MKASEVDTLKRMKENLISEIRGLQGEIQGLQEKVKLFDRLLSGETVIEDEVETKGPGPQRRIRTASSTSIYARVQEVILSNPNKEFTTTTLAAALKKQWKSDYGTKKNLKAVISAILTDKKNQAMNAKWCTRAKKNGKWYFKSNEKAPLRKSA